MEMWIERWGHVLAHDSVQFLRGILAPVLASIADGKPFVIHQFYGSFRDGRPIEDFPIFCDSKREFEAMAARQGYLYKLWGADELDSLVRIFTDDSRLMD